MKFHEREKSATSGCLIQKLALLSPWNNEKREAKHNGTGEA
jgi:hypothetical protein